MSARAVVAPHEVETLLERLEGQARIGIDTEFMRERTYYARLCLVQVATSDCTGFLDPLAGDGLEDAWTTLLQREWVLHSGRQDIEVLYQTTGRMPPAVFDTQIAAALLGFAPQIGYAGLVRELFGRDLPKGHTRADWSQRPLPGDMLRYAAEDVEFLLEAAALLGERLESLGRLDWAREDSAALLDRSLYDVDVDTAIDRLKGARNLAGRPRRAAIRLAAWRERRAIDADRPRQWILKDAAVLAIAQTNPRDETGLAAIEGVPPATVRRSGTKILELLRDAENAPGDDYRPPARPDEDQKKLLKRLQKEVADAAGELDIAAEIVAPRRELAALSVGGNEARVLSGWRRDVVGARLAELLS